MSDKKDIGFKAVVLREMKRIISRPIYLVMIFVLPFICFLFFSTFMEKGLPSKLPIGVVDHDNTPTSRNAIRQINATQQSEVVATFTSFSDARNAMQQQDIDAFIEFPKHFEKDILSSRQPNIYFYYNNVYMIPASLLNKNMATMAGSISASVTLKTMKAKGMDDATIMGQIQPIVSDFHAIGNPWINYAVSLVNVILPGLLGLIVLLTTVFSIGIELKESTGHEWLYASDKKLVVALLGKIFPYTICFTIITILCDILLFKILDFPLNNSILWMFLASFLFVLANQSLGIFMIGTLPVLRDGLSFAGLFGMVSFSFAGLSFPVEGMIPALRSWSYAFPIRHFFLIYQDIALNGLHPTYALFHFAYLLLFLLTPFTVAKRLKNALLYGGYPKK
jgi:ABC-2 type transport system permease protein